MAEDRQKARDRQHRYYRRRKATMDPEAWREWMRAKYIRQVLRQSERDATHKPKGSPPDASY